MNRHNESNLEKNELEPFEKELQASLEQLDDFVLQSIPTSEWFDQFAKAQLKRRHQRAFRDLLLFFCLAPFMICSTLVTLAYGLTSYLVFQIIALLIISIPFVWKRRKQEDAL